ncbi:MAG: hypothetical protein V4553_03825 [Bacteroidota bacterium]
MKKLTSFILFTFLVINFLQSCKEPATVFKMNGDINSDTKKQIAELDEKLFKGIMNKDASSVRLLLSPELLKRSGKNLDTLVNNTGQIYNAKEYELLDEFYTKHHIGNFIDSLKTNKGDSTDYVITYRAMNEEMYTSVMVTKNLPVNCLILAVYGKYGNDWKLNVLQIGEYSIFNKIARDYYKTAKDLYSNGSVLDAANMLVITSQLGNPVGDFFHYRNEDAMRIFFSTVLDDANNKFKFPVTVTQLKTMPQIFSVSPQYTGDAANQGIVPLIKYKTNIKLTDTVALKAENKDLQSVIGVVFKGIDQNNKLILYQAYNLADGKPNNLHYGFIQKIK